MKIKNLVSVILSAALMISISAAPFNASAAESEDNTASSSKAEKNVLQESKSDPYHLYEYEFTSGDYEFGVFSDGTCSITCYLGKNSDIILPDKADGKKVTCIAPYTFRGRSDIKNVTIPEGVKEIQLHAFMQCKNLNTVKIPSSVEKIGTFAFGECFNLTLQGYSGSAAELYAREYDVSFTSIGNLPEGAAKPVDNSKSYPSPERFSNTDNYINLYAYNDEYKGYFNMPEEFDRSYQITLPKDYEYVTYSVSNNEYLVVDVDATGLVTPSSETVTIVDGNEENTYTEYRYGTSVVTVYADEDVYIYTFNVCNYAHIYAKNIIETYLCENINASMTDEEKLEKICQFVAGYDYINIPIEWSAYGMVISRGGDCWNSTYLVTDMCNALGFYSTGRFPGYEGTNHMNNYVKLNNGKSYIVDCGYSMLAPRYYSINETNVDESEKPKNVINRVDITVDTSDMKVGSKPIFNGTIPLNDPFLIESPYYISDTSREIWSEANGDKIASSSKLEYKESENFDYQNVLNYFDNKKYKYSVKYLQANYDYAFSKDVEVYINGVKAIVTYNRGDVISFSDSGITLDLTKQNSVIIGDVDHDGKITSADSLLILRQSVGLEYFTDLERSIADIDGDGKVTSADALEVLRYSVSLPTKYNIGSNV